MKILFKIIISLMSVIIITACGYVEEGNLVGGNDVNGGNITPVADFVGTPLSGSAPLTVSFTDQSTGNPTDWSWTFTGAATDSSNEQNPANIIYNTVGTYTVKLIVTGPGGSDEEEKTDYITVTLPEPDSISGLELWLKADAITWLNDGELVGDWPDSSGNGNNATQAGATNRPTYKTGIINGKPVLRFDGLAVPNGDYLDFPSFDMQPATVFVVGKYEAPATNAPFLGNDTNNSYFGYYTTNIYYYSTIANMNIVNANPTTFQIVTGHITPSGSNSSILINGSPVVSGNYNWGASTFIYIGRRDNERFKGDIAEIVFYNRDLNDTERQTVEEYLNDKYSIY